MRISHIQRRFLSCAVGACTAALVLGATATSATAAGTLRGLWHLDESSGTVAADSSGYSNNGINHGAKVGVAGYAGKAYEFGASRSWVEVPSNDSLNPGTSNFTFQAWVKFSKKPDSGVTYDIIRKGLSYTATGEYKLEIASGARARCEAKDSARKVGVVWGPNTSLADGQWHHVGCQRNGSTWSALVDGRVMSKTVAFSSISNTKQLSIGSNYGKEDYLPGVVDEVEISVG